MDFSAILEKISPYLNLSTLSTFVVTALIFFLKNKGVMSGLNNKFDNLANQLADNIKKVIPEKVYLNIESLAKTELAKITANINEVINKEVLSQITANKEILKAIAEALCSMKSLPDSSKETISKLLEIENVETTSALKIELLPVETTEVKNTNILID